MKWQDFSVQCPLVLGGGVNEAEVLGSSVWLWMHSERHRDAPLHTLPALLLPVIKARQYVLAFRHDQPVFFMSWAWFSHDAEQRYLTRHALMLKEDDWCSGERMWVTDWVAPFGHTRQMVALMRNELFPDHCMRSLWHRGAERGLRVKSFYGKDVSQADKQRWRQTFPLAADVPDCG